MSASLPAMNNCGCASALPSTSATHRSLSSRSAFPPSRQDLKSPSQPDAQSEQHFSKARLTTDALLTAATSRKGVAEFSLQGRIAASLCYIQSSNGLVENARHSIAGSRLPASSLRGARGSRNGRKKNTAVAAAFEDDEEGTDDETSAAEASGRVDSAAAAPLPTMEDIIAAAEQDGVKLTVNSLGPTFDIMVASPDGSRLFGTAQGFIRVWTQGKILHLESVKLDRGLSKKVGNVFGAGFFVGAAILRYGLDRGCRIAQLMAIYDDEVTHSKLVKYYSRLGFKVVYEVGEENLRHIPDRVMWGGVGTRMDADCEELIRRWAAALRPKQRTPAPA